MIGPASSVTFLSVPKPFKMFIANSRVLGGGDGRWSYFLTTYQSSVMFDTLDNSLYGVTLLSKLLFQPLIIYSTLEKQNTKT